MPHQVHLRGKDLEPDVDLQQLARDLPGLVGADLAAVVNEASIMALKAGRSAIARRDLYEGIDRLTQVRHGCWFGLTLRAGDWTGLAVGLCMSGPTAVVGKAMLALKAGRSAIACCDAYEGVARCAVSE